MNSSNDLLKEVKKDIRKDFVLSFLKKHAKKLVIAIVVVIVFMISLTLYNNHIKNKAEANSIVFYEIKEKIALGQTEEVKELLLTLSKDGTEGYRFLSYLERVSLNLQDSLVAEAIALLQESQKELSSLPSYYINFLQNLEFSIRMNEEDVSLTEDIKSSLDKSDIFFYHNLEMYAALLIKETKYEEALTSLNEIIEAEDAPLDVQERSTRIKNLLAGYIN